jgi:hypothetical protein
VFSLSAKALATVDGKKQNKPKYPRFHPEIKGFSKNKANSNPFSALGSGLLSLD